MLYRLRELREARFLSLRDLAAKAGVAYVTIHRIETGQRVRPYPSTLRKLAKALGVEPAELVVREE